MEKKSLRGPVQIYFASHSGTASNFATTLQSELKEKNILSVITDLKAFHPEAMVAKSTSVFLMATHYEGDPPDNAVRFWDWCSKEKHPNDLLKDMQYTVFGLGNNTYEFFNRMGRRTEEFLRTHGAKCIYDYGEGSDHDNKVEEYFDEWRKNLASKLYEVLPECTLEEVQKEKKYDYSVKTTTSNFLVTDLGHETKEPVWDGVSNVPVDSNVVYEFQTEKLLSAFKVKAMDSKELRQKPNDFESTIHFELDLEEAKSKIYYETACDIDIYPENTEALVKEAAEYLGLDLQSIVKIEENPGAKLKNAKRPFPSPIRVDTLLRKFVDLSGPPKKTSLKQLSELTFEPESKKK